MSRVCEICGKTSNKANQKKLLRGHINTTATKRQYPNLQSKKMPVTITSKGVEKTVLKRVRTCTRCIRTNNKKSA